MENEFFGYSDYTLEPAAVMKNLIQKQEEMSIKKAILSLQQAFVSEKKIVRIVSENYMCSEEYVYELLGKDSEMVQAIEDLVNYLTEKEGIDESRAVAFVNKTNVVTLLRISNLAQSGPEELFNCICRINLMKEGDMLRWIRNLRARN